jgi:hypothetical protein
MTDTTNNPRTESGTEAPADRPLLATIYLKSGHVLTYEVQRITVKRNALNQFTELSWELSNPDERMLYLRIDEIDAITTEHLPVLAEVTA